MDIFTSIFAGLGLFFIGIRLIGNNLKQLAGRRMRTLIAKAVSSNWSVILFGLLSGAIMQSVNAVTHVLVALVSVGAIEKKRAFPVISWANIGTSMLVILATLNMHMLILILIGMTGMMFYLKLDQSSRYRHIIGALLGVGLLFLGIDFIKAGSGILKTAVWLKDFMVIASQYPVLSFSTGVGVAMLTQSSSTITVISMAMASAGLLSFDSGSMIVLGSGLGSALSAWTTAGGLKGSALQLILYQIFLRISGVLVMVTVFFIDKISEFNFLSQEMIIFNLTPSSQLATVYVSLQFVSDITMRIIHKPIENWIEKQAPLSVEEILGRPRYIYDEALVEPETALLLVDKEQQRLSANLSSYLNNLRDERDDDNLSVQMRYNAENSIANQCEQFLTELVDKNNSRFVLDKTIILRDRNMLIHSLQESLLELSQVIHEHSESSHEVRSLLHNLVESLHMMLETLTDVLKSLDPDDLEILKLLTHDRSELMDSIRRRMQNEQTSAQVQQSVFSATTLFERCVWLLRRYVLLLNAPKN